MPQPQHKPAPAKTVAKPTFKEVIALQSSEGFWQPQSLATLQQFFKAPLPTHLPATTICTLVALVVLETFFMDNEGEWQLMAQKARAYLTKLGAISL